MHGLEVYDGLVWVLWKQQWKAFRVLHKNQGKKWIEGEMNLYKWAEGVCRPLDSIINWKEKTIFI